MRLNQVQLFRIYINFVKWWNDRVKLSFNVESINVLLGFNASLNITWTKRGVQTSGWPPFSSSSFTHPKVLLIPFFTQDTPLEISLSSCHICHPLMNSIFCMAWTTNHYAGLNSIEPGNPASSSLIQYSEKWNSSCHWSLKCDNPKYGQYFSNYSIYSVITTRRRQFYLE